MAQTDENIHLFTKTMNTSFHKGYFSNYNTQNVHINYTIKINGIQ
jgi:hypothetical protein